MATKKQSNKTTVVEKPVVEISKAKSAAKKAPVAKKATESKATAPVATPSAATAPKAKATKTTAAKASAKTAAPKTATAKTAKPALKTKKINFSLPKEAVENAEKVALVGDFCSWDITKSIALNKQKDGSFKTALELETGRSYQFRYLIDGTKWENAWDAEAYEPTPFGAYNSVVKA